MIELTISSIRPDEDGGTGHRWMAMWGDGYDASAETIVGALAELVRVLGEALERGQKP